MSEFIIYQHDEFGFYTGQSKLTDKWKGIPYRWSKVPLPEIPEGKFAQLNGDKWDIKDEIYRPALPIPTVVTMRQARLALLQAGLLPTVEAALDALEEPARSAAKIEWKYAQEVERGYPWVEQLTATMGMTEEQVDNLFILAATL